MTSDTFDKSAQDTEMPAENMITRMCQAIFDPLRSLSMLIVVTFFVAIVAAAVFTDRIFQAIPDLCAQPYQAVASRLASETMGAPTQGQVLKAIGQYNLAWFYVTNSVGQIDAATKAYAPELKAFRIRSPG